MGIGKNVAKRRDAMQMTRQELAARLGVDVETLELWEREELPFGQAPGDSPAGADRLSPGDSPASAGSFSPECGPAGAWTERAAWALETTADYLERLEDYGDEWDDHGERCLAEHMYQYVRRKALSGDMAQTLRILPLMRKYHGKQVRKGRDGDIPYIVHPLTIACQCFALGVADDEIIPVALLHDVVEDCGVTLEELPVTDAVRAALEELTFYKMDGESKAEAKARYYAAIQKDRVAMLVKAMDRCNNVSTMAMCFSREKMLEYIEETLRYVVPLIDRLKKRFPEYEKACFQLKYHILGVVESLRHVLTQELG